VGEAGAVLSRGREWRSRKVVLLSMKREICNLVFPYIYNTLT
jgi:hypothetical protein